MAVEASIEELFPKLRLSVGRTAGKVDCDAEWRWHPPAPLSDFDMWYVTDGRGEIQIRGETYPVQKGSFILLRPGDWPMASQDPNHRLTVIFTHFSIRHIDGDTGELPDLRPMLPPHHSCVQDTFLMERLLHRLLDVIYFKQPFQAIEFDCLAKVVLLHLLRLQSEEMDPEYSVRQHQLIRQVTRHVRSNIHRHITRDELAALVDLSPPYLSRLFKSSVGMSIRAFVIQQRLERASHLLTETSMTISHIADSMGYSDVSFFSKQFKSHFGCSPEQFRKRMS